VFKSVFWYSLYPSFIWFLIILGGSLLPASNLPGIAVSDKFIHVLFYAIFSFFLFLLSHNEMLGLYTTSRKWFFVFLIVTLLGAGIEWIQYALIPERSGEWFDILANSFGLMIILFTTYLLKRLRVL
tara:strand:+ start:353 stop:733 length:381 start_codon:yes stop_codon:yes gene_type:complete